MASRDAPVGGQAVLEGVMMRGVSTWAVAVRVPETNRIELTSFPLTSWLKRHRVLRLPVIRGVVALAESLKIGFSALQISANAQLVAEGEEPQELSKAAWAGTIVAALALAVGLFFVVPVTATSLIKDQLHSSFLFWLVEGVLRTRGGRRARPRARRALLPPAPPVRDELPAHRHDRRHLRLRPDRAARLGRAATAGRRGSAR